MSKELARQEPSLVEVIYDMPAADYHRAPGLSHSAMKDLKVSDLRFWYNHVRSDREPIEPTEFMIFGEALHSALFDGDSVFDSKFACELNPDDYPGILIKADDLKQFIKDHGGIPKGTTKAGWSAQVREISATVPILDELEKIHFVENQGKSILKIDDWRRLAECSNALASEPAFAKLREKGKSEVSYFVTDPETGVRLKARMDFVTPDHTLDPKTFSSKGKSIDRAVSDAMFYEGYFRQGYLYTYIRHLAGEGVVPFINCFVESEQPHEVRLRKQVRSLNGSDTLYWSTARDEVKRMIQRYADLMARFGPDKAWRTDAEVETIADEDIPALAWGN